MNLPKGWLAEAEAQLLQQLATGKTVLELGAWRGRSTVAMAETATYLVSVDRHQGIAGIDESDSLPHYLAAVRTYPNVAIVIASFEQFVPLLADQKFDLVFIDGNHDRQAVARDTELACDLSPDVIAYHDWDFEQVRQGAGDVIFGGPDEIVGSLAVFKGR